MTVADDIRQLQQQQSLITQALRGMLEGTWCGAPPSAQAFTDALDPTMGVGCTQPFRETDVPPPPDIFYDPETGQPGQLYSWTCSACASDWVLRAHGSGFSDDAYTSREATGEAIGYPENINSTYGLMDGSGAQLQRVIKEQAGLDSAHAYLSFDQAYAVYSVTPGCMSGGSWYHWVGVRGVSGPNLYIANSAPGYMGVWDILSRDDFNRLGPFSCIAVIPS